ncbi:transcriptional regulator [Clostridium zeae]|uniref:Transcriptional regulator n=1 Tax=Clostridium zeae TaxID=2759022 RepID=A0ABQ1EE45_9CLOT|nr:YafY family protein [Clostridium zeae]GFZ33050.1 transcriptional regulator [Clostridium zeae]
MKIDRLISIIMLLLERKQISATKLAEMFEVTPRTIYRDVETISLSGIPIVAYPGVNGGISIMEEYKIEKKLFTISDITSLLIGLGSIHSTMTSEEVLNTMAKVKGMVPADHIKNIELKSKQITVDHTPWIGNRNLNINLEEIKIALSENKLISFKYYAQNGIKSQRKIEPYRLVLKNSSWYLQGYCTTRDDFRVFKLSRISSLELLEETFISREFNYKTLEVSTDIEKKKVPIKLLIDESLLDTMIEFCGMENIEPFGNNKFIASFPFIEDDFSYSMILRLGDKCECLEPENIRLEIIKRVENLLKVYKKEE